MKRRRKPQPRCQCGHARSRHGVPTYPYENPNSRCNFCWESCPQFEQDNLVTLERLSEYYETKNI